MRSKRTLAFAMLFSVLAVLPLFAAQRTFVSSAGLDTNPCSRDLPCRTFAAAMAQTSAGGELVVLDSAGYGAMTIGQSVAVIAPIGVHAGITAFSGASVTINAATTDTIVLRNLSLNAQGGATGVSIQSAASVYIEHCLVYGFSQKGIQINAMTTPPSVFIADTTVRNCASSGVSTYAANLSINRSVFAKNGFGVVMHAGSASITDTIADGNTAYGFYFYADSGDTTATFNNVTASHNNHGIWIDGGTVVMIGGGSTGNTTNGFYVGHLFGTGNPTLVAENVEVSHNPHGIVIVANADVTLVEGVVTDNQYGVEIDDNTATVRMSRTTVTKNSSIGVWCSVLGPAVLSNGENLVNGNTVDNQNCTVTSLTKF